MELPLSQLRQQPQGHAMKLTRQAIRERVVIDPKTRCWHWQRACSQTGYGYLRDENSRQISAHRASWEVFKGRIPKGMWVLHKRKCFSRDCCNPSHLYLGTAKDNRIDVFAVPGSEFIRRAAAQNFRNWNEKRRGLSNEVRSRTTVRNTD